MKTLTITYVVKDFEIAKRIIDDALSNINDYEESDAVMTDFKAED
jgi:hypothetical protein